MKKWSLRPDPSPHDAARYALRVKGEMRHINQLIKKFGALCGRPLKIDDTEGFNYRIHLHGLTQLGLEKITRYLEEVAPGANADKGQAPAGPAAPELLAPPPVPVPTEASGGPPFVQEVPTVPVAELFAPPPATETAAAPPATEPSLSGPVLTPPGLGPQMLPEGEPPPAAAPEPAPEIISLAPPVLEPPAPAPPAPALSFEPPPAAPPVPPPAAAGPGLTAPPPPAALGAPPPPVAKPLWGLQTELNAKLNFDTLMVGAYDRFAHAAATSVVGSPGSMYNPLFIYGAPGVGKTHILHAIGAALAKTWDERSVVMTTGSSLAAAVSAAKADGQFAQIEQFLAGAKALLVDDVHLLALSDKNQAALSKIFQDFFARSLQVVLTSVYAPRTLGAMEEALKISLAKGWAVDMKIPNAVVQGDMINAFAERCGLQVSPAEIKKLHEKLGNANYNEFPRYITRWVALSDFYRGRGQEPSTDQILNDLTSPGARASQTDIPSAADLATVRGFVPPGAGPDALNLALFCPKGQDPMVPWLVARFYKVAADFGLTRTYRHVLCEAYDAEQPLGVPSQIGESTRRAGAHAALVLGPPQESKLAAREGEFAHAVRHILESSGLAVGWIPFSETSATRPFLAAHLDFMTFHRK